MTTAVTVQQGGIPALAMNEAELMGVLRNSLYPGAKDESIKLVISYCKASQLDPMQKPVHIVPMSVSTGKKDGQGWDIKEMRDVVMPGIGLYRTQAARSGEYAGVSEPEFGEDVTETLDGVSVTFPKWCKVIVRRLMANGAIVEFAAKELWKENYAAKSSKSEAPNAMWKKRPYAQLAKCAEAQALRKAFPEIGSQPTADEMEGKDMVVQEYDVTPKSAALPAYPAEKFDEHFPAWESVIRSGKKTAAQVIATVESKNTLTDTQKVKIRSCEYIEAETHEDA